MNSADVNIIIGCGLTGCVIANILAINGEKVLIIEKRNHIGGNIYDYKDEPTGITIHKYGPHIFHTNNKQVWDYLSKYTKWHNFIFKPLVMINGKEVNLPFNLNSVHACFSSNIADEIEKELIKEYGYGNKVSIIDLLKNESSQLKTLADFVYNYVFKNYTKKQWGTFPNNTDKSVMSRVPVVISYDNRYFHDKYQGIPQNGYTELIKNLINNKNITIKLNTAFIPDNKNYKRIICTGSIDEYFNYKYGKLPYRSLNFDIKTIDKELYQNAAMVNYPNENNYTRITEHKYFLNEKSSSTVISLEYPCNFNINKNERFYPIINTKNLSLYNKYINEAKKNKNLYFAGRLGEYKYYNMDAAVENAMNLAQLMLKG